MATYAETRIFPPGLGIKIAEFLYPNNPFDHLKTARPMIDHLATLQVPDAKFFNGLVDSAKDELIHLYDPNRPGNLFSILDREDKALQVVDRINDSRTLLERVYIGCSTPEDGTRAVQKYATDLIAPGEAMMNWVNGHLVFSGTRWKVWQSLNYEVNRGLVNSLDVMVNTAKETGKASVLEIDQEWKRVYDVLDRTMRMVVWGR